MSNPQKKFRRKYLSEISRERKIDIIYQFVNGELSLNTSIHRNFISNFLSKFKPKAKRHTETVIDEFEKNIKKYPSFEFLKILLNHHSTNPELYSMQDMQRIFDIYIKELFLIDKQSTPISEDTDLKKMLSLIYGLDTIMTEDNFKLLYSFVSSHTKPYIEYCEKIKSDPREYDIRNRYFLYPWIHRIHFLILSALNNEQNSSKNIFDIVGNDLNTYYKYDYFFMDMENRRFPSIQIFLKDPQNKKSPKDILEFYEFIVENNLSNPNLHQFFFGIQSDILPNLSWSSSDYMIFLSQVKENKNINLPLAFMMIDLDKKENPELNNIFNNFIKENKKEYMLWCICDNDPESFLKYSVLGKGYYTDSDIETYMYIVDELINRQQNNNIRYIDIKKYRGGGTSKVHRIGDYVIKNGTMRFIQKDRQGHYSRYPIIPNHRRILQPIIRCYNEKMLIEVADRVIPWGPPEIVMQIFDEMLEDGYAWMDPRGENIGMLTRPNIPRHNIEKKVVSDNQIEYIADTSSSSEIATNITGQINGEPLQAGEYVILDTDLIYDLRDPSVYSKLIYQKYMTKEMRKKLEDKIAEFEKGRKPHNLPEKSK